MLQVLLKKDPLTHTEAGGPVMAQQCLRKDEDIHFILRVGVRKAVTPFPLCPQLCLSTIVVNFSFSICLTSLSFSQLVLNSGRKREGSS